MTPEKIPFCNCENPTIENPHLDDGAMAWCEECGLLVIENK